MQLWGYLRTRLNGEGGATMVEYGIMVSLVAMAAFLAVTAFGGGVLSLFERLTFP